MTIQIKCAICGETINHSYPSHEVCHQCFSEWISLEDRFPTPETSQGECFLVVRFGNMGKRHVTIRRFCCKECWVGEHVTHWMPLPPPPKAN
jgi:hypothetical protein